MGTYRPLPKLAAPAQRALAGAGIATLQDVANHRKADVAKLHGMGPNALKRLEEALITQGLAFKE